ncbi:hypothetical protein [Actinomadura sp. 3N407]|uniref:hypothetical protein n=1 Tax=Actinomadura sp. 3N407 TaxID=3457423 RepID=UPI003FCE06B2
MPGPSATARRLRPARPARPGADAAELIGALGLEPAHLVGMSQGAAVARMPALDQSR